MMNKIQVKLLNKLIDKYEKSKSFQGENKVTQNFTEQVAKLFQKYSDDAEYEFFCEINDALLELEEQGVIFVEWASNGVAQKVRLNLESLEQSYTMLKRTPRRQEHQWLAEIWKEYENLSEGYRPLQEYITTQKQKVKNNGKVEYYDGNHEDYKDLLHLVHAVLENSDELFIRDFSMKVFGDSKRTEQLEGKVQALLYQYGKFQEKTSVLEECGIVHTPTYVMVKGNGRLSLGGQLIDLFRLKGDIALSTTSLKELEMVQVCGSRVVTVENLTSFHDYCEKADFVVYLGGFHNRTKQQFLIQLYEQNPDKEYRHFGDIDAGGFYILENLKQKTGINFQRLYMNIETLKKYMEMWKPLTGNDIKRLEILEKKLSADIKTEDYREVIKYMLENGCKLEQEAIVGERQQ